MTLFGRFARLAGAVVATMALTSAAFAQIRSEPPVVEQGNVLVLDAIGHKFSLPLPDWLGPEDRVSGKVAPLVQMTFRSSDNEALLEVYPQGEIQALWKTLYGASITLDAGRSLTDYRRTVMAGYSRTCKPELTGFFQFGEDQGQDLAPLGFVCGAYLDQLTGYAGQGEVMVMAFRKSDKGVAVVYQEWRGAAFDPSKPATWPVETDIVQARAKQLQDEAMLTLGE